MSAATNDVLPGAEVLDGDPGDPVSVQLHAADQGEVTEFEPLRERAVLVDERAEDDVGARPAHGAVRLRVAGDRKGANAVALRQLRAELFVEQGPDGLPNGGVGERGTVDVQQLLRVLDELVPFVVGDERDFLAEGGRRRRARPVRALAADVGGGRRRGKARGVGGALAAEVEQVGALAGGEHSLGDGGCRDAERLAVGAGLRPLRHFARTGLFAGVGDVADALAGKLRHLRSGFEHHHPRVRDLLEEHPGIGGADGAAADDGDGGVGHDVSFESQAERDSDVVWGAGTGSSERRPCGSRTAATMPTAYVAARAMKMGVKTEP